MSTILVFLFILSYIFPAISLFLCRYCVHTSTKDHIFQFWSITKKLCRKHEDHITKRPKWLKLSPNKKMDWAGDHLSHLILHNKMKYHLWLYAEIRFRYPKKKDIPKLLWDDIRSYNITDGWMLTSSFKIQQCFWYS